MRSMFPMAALLLPLFYSTAFARPQTTAASTTSTASTACNNSPSLCSRSYGNVTYLGAHDSPFVSNSSNNFDISGNQYFNSTVQLDAGVRLLQAQIQNENSSDPSSALHLCHTSCSLLDAGSLQNWLSEVNSWMGNNPNEVVTILLVNGANANAATLGQIFVNSGITQYSYTPTSKNTRTWPTLQSMISANTRLVTFIASLSDNTGATYLLNEFDYMWENYYAVTSISNFTCEPDRPSTLGGSLSTAKASGRLFMMNHMLYQQQLFDIQSPDVNNATTTNSADTTTIGALGTSANACAAEYGAAPNVLLVDWFNVGPAIQTVDTLNGVSNATGRKTVTTSNLKLTQASSSDACTTSRSFMALCVGLFVALCTSWL